MDRSDELQVPPNQSVLDLELVKVGGRDWNVEFTLDDDAAFPRLEEGLRRYLGESCSWFDGEAVTVNVGRRMLNLNELGRLRQVFEDEFHLKVARFRCEAETLEKAISEGAGVPAALAPKQPTSPLVDEVARPRQAALFVKSTCRSGTIIHHTGDVVVLGDVNPGAQVTATEDIIVFGTLRGIAHAGAIGADPAEAVIIALSLRPLQLRIGRHVSVAPTHKGDHKIPVHPEIAYVSGRSIVVAPFTGRFQWMEERNLL